MNRAPLIHFIVSLVLLVVVVTVYVFWYLFVTGMETKAIALEAEAEQMEAASAQITNARSALSSLTADESFFGSYFVSTSTVVSYLEGVEAIGDSLGSNVEIVSVTPEGKNGSRIAISLRAKGSFAGVMRTIGALEYGSYDVKTTSMTIDTNAASEGIWTASGIVSVGTGPEAEAKPAAPPAEATTPLP